VFFYEQVRKGTSEGVGKQLDEVSELQRFVGWGVHNTLITWQRRSSDGHPKYSENVHKKADSFCTLLKGMRILEGEALLDDDYVQKLYDQSTAWWHDSCP
jgi:hypothetical protein